MSENKVTEKNRKKWLNGSNAFMFMLAAIVFFTLYTLIQSHRRCRQYRLQVLHSHRRCIKTYLHADPYRNAPYSDLHSQGFHECNSFYHEEHKPCEGNIPSAASARCSARCGKDADVLLQIQLLQLNIRHLFMVYVRDRSRHSNDRIHFPERSRSSGRRQQHYLRRQPWR